MAFLLDTNAVIGLLKETTSPLARRVRQEQPGDVVLSAIVAHELFYGAFKGAHAGQNLAVLDGLQFPVIEFDRQDAREAGRIRAVLAALGRPIGPYDVLIAGQALARNFTLVTHNRREFSRIPDLRLEDWQA